MIKATALFLLLLLSSCFLTKEIGTDTNGNVVSDGNAGQNQTVMINSNGTSTGADGTNSDLPPPIPDPDDDLPPPLPG